MYTADFWSPSSGYRGLSLAIDSGLLVFICVSLVFLVLVCANYENFSCSAPYFFKFFLHLCWNLASYKGKSVKYSLKCESSDFVSLPVPSLLYFLYFCSLSHSLAASLIQLFGTQVHGGRSSKSVSVVPRSIILHHSRFSVALLACADSSGSGCRTLCVLNTRSLL